METFDVLRIIMRILMVSVILFDLYIIIEDDDRLTKKYNFINIIIGVMFPLYGVLFYDYDPDNSIMDIALTCFITIGSFWVFIKNKKYYENYKL